MKSITTLRAYLVFMSILSVFMFATAATAAAHAPLRGVVVLDYILLMMSLGAVAIGVSINNMYKASNDTHDKF